jgi:predicted deacetylase
MNLGPQYLLRIDDLCPAMDWRAWGRVEAALEEAGVRPLLAVVPDNRDPALEAGPADDGFWERVRGWQARGWSIGLHGYQHRYETRSSGILGRNGYSEFAGLDEAAQDSKLERALSIFGREGVRADAWVAPGHSFDRTTVKLLARRGVEVISDGYSLYPHAGEDGVLWVPQQLGRFRAVPLGVWTVCLHINGWGMEETARLREDLARFRRRMVSLEAIRQRYARRSAGVADHLAFAGLRLLRSLRG